MHLRYLSLNKLISIGATICVSIIVVILFEFDILLPLWLRLVVPLACIWFSEEIVAFSTSNIQSRSLKEIDWHAMLLTGCGWLAFAAISFYYIYIGANLK
jgi:hypothetical protein